MLSVTEYLELHQKFRQLRELLEEERLPPVLASQQEEEEEEEAKADATADAKADAKDDAKDTAKDTAKDNAKDAEDADDATDAEGAEADAAEEDAAKQGSQKKEGQSADQSSAATFWHRNFSGQIEQQLISLVQLHGRWTARVKLLEPPYQRMHTLRRKAQAAQKNARQAAEERELTQQRVGASTAFALVQQRDAVDQQIKAEVAAQRDSARLLRVVGQLEDDADDRALAIAVWRDEVLAAWSSCAPYLKARRISGTPSVYALLVWLNEMGAKHIFIEINDGAGLLSKGLHGVFGFVAFCVFRTAKLLLPRSVQKQLLFLAQKRTNRHSVHTIFGALLACFTTVVASVEYLAQKHIYGGGCYAVTRSVAKQGLFASACAYVLTKHSGVLLNEICWVFILCSLLC
jgi:hypothetical protein